MLALFGAPPPQATQTLPRLSLCLHACADTVRATATSLSLSSPSPLQVRVRGARRPASEAAATAVAATTTTAEVRTGVCGGCGVCTRADDCGGDGRRRCRRRDLSSSS